MVLHPITIADVTAVATATECTRFFLFQGWFAYIINSLLRGRYHGRIGHEGVRPYSGNPHVRLHNLYNKNENANASDATNKDVIVAKTCWVKRCKRWSFT
jgi:hypothetical protein